MDRGQMDSQLAVDRVTGKVACTKAEESEAWHYLIERKQVYLLKEWAEEQAVAMARKGISMSILRNAFRTDEERRQAWEYLLKNTKDEPELRRWVQEEGVDISKLERTELEDPGREPKAD